MPYGYKYPAGNEIYKGKIKKGDLSDVPDGKLYREGLEIDVRKKKWINLFLQKQKKEITSHGFNRCGRQAKKKTWK